MIMLCISLRILPIAKPPKPPKTSTSWVLPRVLSSMVNYFIPLKKTRLKLRNVYKAELKGFFTFQAGKWPFPRIKCGKSFELKFIFKFQAGNIHILHCNFECLLTVSDNRIPTIITSNFKLLYLSQFRRIPGFKRILDLREKNVVTNFSLKSRIDCTT